MIFPTYDHDPLNFRSLKLMIDSFLVCETYPSGFLNVHKPMCLTCRLYLCNGSPLFAIMVMTVGETVLNNVVEYCSVVLKNEITMFRYTHYTSHY